MESLRGHATDEGIIFRRCLDGRIGRFGLRYSRLSVLRGKEDLKRSTSKHAILLTHDSCLQRAGEIAKRSLQPRESNAKDPLAARRPINSASQCNLFKNMQSVAITARTTVTFYTVQCELDFKR